MRAPEVSQPPIDTSVEGCGLREPAMLALIQAVEAPLLTSLQEEYGADRGWAVCGPASIVLGNLISHNTGIPFKPGGDDEHIELEIGIFVPKPPSRHQPMDHSYLLYDAGTGGDMITVDAVGALLWEDYPKLDGAIRTDWHCRWHLMSDLWDEYRLTSYNPITAYQHNLPLWDGERDQRSLQQGYREFIRIMHSPQAFENDVITWYDDHRDVSAFWGDRLLRVMHATAQRAGVEAPF